MCFRVNTNKGFVSFITVVFLLIMLFIGLSFVGFVFAERKNTINITNAVGAKHIAEAGLEKAIWSLNYIDSYSGETATQFGQGEFSVTVEDIGGGKKLVTSTGYIPNTTSAETTRTVSAHTFIDSSIISFNYGVQVGNGGFEMRNNATINGNVFSNSTIEGFPGTTINGTAVSATEDGLIDGVVVQEQAKADELRNCQVDGDAHYNFESGCTISGLRNTPFEVPDAENLPLSDSDILEWKQDAEAGGVHAGSMAINEDTNLGPIKIEGSLSFGNNIQVDIAGPIWVTGSVSLGNNMTLKLGDSYDKNSEVFIADGRFDVANNAILQGDEDGSYIIMLSESPSLSESSPAIQVSNNSNTALFYARNGLVVISNNSNLKAVTAYKILMKNGSELTYDEGLANSSFNSGPGGSWAFIPGTYVVE